MCQTCGHVSQMHTKNYAFYTGKSGFLKKKSEPVGGGAPHLPLFESATARAH